MWGPRGAPAVTDPRRNISRHSCLNLAPGYFSLSHRFLPPAMAGLRTVNELLAGSVGGAAQVLVGQPLDTIKTRAQIAPRECRLNLRSGRRLIVCGFTS